MDKLTVAALEATVSLYLRGQLDAIPALRMMRLSRQEITPRAERLAERISERLGFFATVREGESLMGGGSTPGQGLPTSLVAVTHARHSAQELEEVLRRHKPAVVARLDQNELILDLRTVFEGQEDEIVRAFEPLTIDD